MMGCESWMDALSARADGEDPGIDERLVDAHLSSCAGCRDFVLQLEALRQPARVSEAPHMPDLSRRVVKLNAMADRASRWGMARALLGLVAVEIIVLSVPALILGHDGSGSAHAARHLGAFSLAYAAGLLVVVVRPARARTVLPVALVLAGALAVTAIIDVAEGHVPLLGEAVHIPELLSVLLVWLLARPAPERSATSEGRPGSGPLELVDPDEPRRSEREAG